MKLRTLIFVSYVLGSAMGFAILMAVILWEVRPRYVEAMRRNMSETAALLAAMLESKLTPPERDKALPFQDVSDLWTRELDSLKTLSGRLRVYVTDSQGIVIGDSNNGADIGKDYTRRPEMVEYFSKIYPDYGNTDLVNDELRLTHPVNIGGQTLAFVGVGRPLSSVRQFILRARIRLALESLVIATVMVFMGWWLASVVTRPIGKLTDYALRARSDSKIVPPRSRATEIRRLGAAFESLRRDLEGKAHVEHTTQTLAHEIKAPLAAIRGAAELLREDLPPRERLRFLDNLEQESARIGNLIERLLQLSALEARHGRLEREELELKTLVEGTIESLAPLTAKAEVQCCFEAETPGRLQGERFLLAQSITNLLRNALDFSPRGATIWIHLKRIDSEFILSIRDLGPGIPAYALPKVFDRFYSLPRPDGGRRSTGLGLNFVKECAALHGGTLSLGNHPEQGALAELRLPV